MNEKYLQIIRLGRPQNTRFPVALLGLFCSIEHLSLTTFLLLAIAYVGTYQVITAANNMYDIRIDRDNNLLINPLTRNLITRQNTISYVVVSAAIASCAVVYLANVKLMGLVTMSVLLGLWYSYPSWGLSYKHYFGTIALCFWYGALPVLMVGIMSGRPLYLQATAFSLLIVPLILTKDYRDVKGDRKARKMTPLLRYGQVNILSTSAMSWLVASFLLLYITKTLLLIPALLSYWLLIKQQHMAKTQGAKGYTYLALTCVLLIFYFTAR
jgi:4-hydroxybenzoate polyprenyltransferase